MPGTNRKTVENLISRTKVYLAIIAILLIILCVYNVKLIVPAIILYGLIIAYSLWVNNKRVSEISKHIQELTLNVDSAAKNTLINSPFPLAVIETDGNIVWKSSNFIKEFMNIDINNYLDEIAREVKLKIENQEEKTIDREIQIGEKIYHVVGEYVKSKKKGKKQETEYMMTLYFVDKTAYSELLEKYNDSKTCIGIIMVDNYEEIMNRVANEIRPEVIARIEKEIYKWAAATGGIAVKTDRETYVYVFEQKYLKELEDNKFNILDTIKEIDIGGKLQLTLSIAISNEGKSDYEIYKSALAAMDIALGRGGDQAIVRRDQKYHFYGGRTQEMEKRTKVKARIVAHALEELINESKNVMIMGHSNGDIDCMGSSLGIYRLAKTLGKEAYIVNNTVGLTLANFMESLKKEKEYQESIIDQNEAMAKIDPETLLVIVDTHKKGYVEVPELLQETEKIVIIDHHRRSTDYIEAPILSFQEVYASSAAELVTEILQYSECDVKLKSIEIESLYAGIMMDTKNFTFKTGVRTFEAAAYLRKLGVDIIRVKKWFQSDLASYNTISEIVKDAEIVNDTIAISVYQKTDKDAGLICAKAADELLTISDITASFVMGNLGDKITISGRSIGDINVQVILEKLGGGGHITLAGAQVEGMTMGEVKQELINRINEYFSEIAG